MYRCNFCKKEYENPKSIGSHTKWCKSNPNRYIPFKFDEQIELKRKTNLYKSNTNSNLIEKRKLGWKKSFIDGKHKPREISYETEIIRRLKISKKIKENPNCGGLRRGSGRGNKGWYKGYWCDSSWELAWVIYNLEHDIKFKRNTVGFQYEHQNKIKKYYPDFIIEDTYYEIKGRRSFEKLNDENKQKIKQFRFSLKVLYEKDIKPYISYVINKYGKDYTRLYE